MLVHTHVLNPVCSYRVSNRGFVMILASIFPPSIVSDPPLVALHLARGETNRTADYLIIAASGHRLLEPLTQRVLAFFELLDFLLQVVADALDARQRSFAGQRRL